MNKIVIYLVVLIILALAGESGYYLGVNAGKRIGIQETLKNQNKQAIEKTTNSAIIPVIDQSVIQWVGQINSFPADFLWKSAWNTIIGGKFISMDDNSITLFDINGSSRKLTFPTAITEIETVKFSQYDQKEKRYFPNSISRNELKTGDVVSVNISVNTLSGITEFFELTKQLNQRVIN